MKWQIAFFVVGFLEKNVSTDACFFQLPVVFYSCRCDIYVYTANGPIFMFDAVDGFDAFQNIFDGIVFSDLPLLPGQDVCDQDPAKQ